MSSNSATPIFWVGLDVHKECVTAVGTGYVLQRALTESDVCLDARAAKRIGEPGFEVPPPPPRTFALALLVPPHSRVYRRSHGMLECAGPATRMPPPRRCCHWTSSSRRSRVDPYGS